VASTALVAVGDPTAASAQAPTLAALQDEAVELLGEYIRVNTINPPGNESRAVEFFARIFEAEGIPYETAESAPGRGNIWARIPGGDAPALVLLHHSDVVPADPDYWTADPLGGDEMEGLIYGRGAVDTKGLGIVHLQAFLALHRSGRTPDRDVIFMATADEEAGGFFGAGWLVENRPELFENVGVVLNEGGGGTLLPSGEQQFGIEVTQKVPVWLRLEATGTPGHGSTPRAESAVTRLVRALDRLRDHAFEARIIEPVDAYFKGIAPTSGDEWREPFQNLAAAVQDADFLARLQLHDPFLHALTRNTCSLTRLEGSSKINVVPPTAAAEIDCRVLPDQDIDAFRAEITTVINDPAIELSTLMAFSPAVSATTSDAYAVLVDVTQAHFPEARAIPSVASGFTDSHFFRDLGIDAYGYAPFLIPQRDDERIHGNDERISVENIRRGTLLMIEILDRLTGAPRM
jgi:acetylornithine deacetylase/succinyl-diaminopimelate desuccinylase-like protein